MYNNTGNLFIGKPTEYFLQMNVLRFACRSRQWAFFVYCLSVNDNLISISFMYYLDLSRILVRNAFGPNLILFEMAKVLKLQGYQPCMRTSERNGSESSLLRQLPSLENLAVENDGVVRLTRI